MKPWPKVLPRDNGIRPAGRPDECFYCKSRVGDPHGPECVCVMQTVRYEVKYEGVEVGSFTREDPYHWTFHDCDFHKNESSWCVNNAIESIVWRDTAYAQKVKETVEGLDSAELCCCNLPLEFVAVEVVDPGPFQDSERSQEEWDDIVRIGGVEWKKNSFPQNPQ